MPKTILVIGCGLGGATLAIAAMRRGFKVRIYEQAARLQELGAGLTLPANSMRVFDDIGIWDRVADITTVQNGMAYVHYQTGEVLSGAHDPDWTGRPQSPELSGHTHRAMLHGLLVDIIGELDPEALQTGHRLEGLDQDETGVIARFTNGVTAKGDILVGCDGLHSVTHKLLFGENKPSFTGVVAMRATIPTDMVRPYLSGGRAMNFVGPQAGFLRYGVKEGTLLNCVGLARTDRWLAEGWDNKSSREELLSIYGDFHPDVVGIIENGPADGFFKWALYDREPLRTWTRGRATLLGDAAHPMLPFLGQGATQAIEDALVLARSLAAYEDIDQALGAYEAARVDRVAWIVEASRQQGAALTQTDPNNYAAMKVDYTKLSLYDPRTVPV